MQATDWAPEHSDALREFLAKGMPYAKAADAINAKFETAYTRNAAIGRGKRNDPLGRLHSHRQIDEAQYRGGRAFQNDWERAERGPQAVDPTREYVDGVQKREPVTEGQRRAVLRLGRVERELGADGAALVHEVLVKGLSMEQVGQRRNLRTQRWRDYFARRFYECLDRLALIYGFATEQTGAARTVRRPVRSEAR
jgi:GcrA cell cycle regulator